ncbi:MAG TPA: hypothetical protein VFG30_22705 [Polyangiales bacterium]|jgi:hypothetical protein|nr:hypothetical protein [Polyangiales bacterium]
MSSSRFRVLMCVLGLAGSIGFALIRPQPSAAQDDDDLGEAVESEGSDAPTEGDAPDADAQAPAEATAVVLDETPAEPPNDVIARAFIGGGLGTRTIRRPVPGGVQRVGTLFFPAADVGIAVRVFPREAFTLDILARYQTSLGLVVKEPVLFALDNEVDVRSEHAEISVAPGWRLGEAETSARVTFPIGVAFRNFWPADHHLQTPRYTLIGPHARIELQAMLGSSVRFRAGPEAQLYGIIGSDLTDQGGVSSPSFAIGAEASLEFRLNTTFLLEFEYRQSNATASSKVSDSFLDVERFATVRLAGEM